MFLARLSPLPFVLLVLSVSVVSGQTGVMPDEAKEKLAYSIGVQAYIYGQPLMDTYRTFWENTLDPNRGHDRTVNELNLVRKLVTPSDTWVVSPNNDTMYLRGFFDLTDEPVVLHIPEMGERKFWFPLSNIYHNLYDYLGWDTIGFRGGDYALTAPGWSGLLPEGVHRVEMTTPMGWTLGRYVVDGEADVAAVTKLQDKTWLVPLSEWKLGMTSAPRAKVDPSRYPKLTNEDLDDAEKFFTTMNEMLRRNPPLKQDHALLGWFREINLHPEQRFDWTELDEPTKNGLTRAVKDALAIIAEREKNFAPPVNGWVPAIMPGDQSDQPLYHAATTKLGLLYSQKEVSIYYVGFIGSNGKPLDGSNIYTIELSPPPPVQAFWSLTMYHANTKFLVANDINRYSIGDRTRGLKAKEDGSLTITISADQPSGGDAKANWLPAPDGAFFLVLRAYSPKPAVLNGGWQPSTINLTE